MCHFLPTAIPTEYPDKVTGTPNGNMVDITWTYTGCWGDIKHYELLLEVDDGYKPYTFFSSSTRTYSLENCTNWFDNYMLTALTVNNEVLVSPVIGENTQTRTNKTNYKPIKHADLLTMNVI